MLKCSSSSARSPVTGARCTRVWAALACSPQLSSKIQRYLGRSAKKRLRWLGTKRPKSSTAPHLSRSARCCRAKAGSSSPEAEHRPCGPTVKDRCLGTASDKYSNPWGSPPFRGLPMHVSMISHRFKTSSQWPSRCARASASLFPWYTQRARTALILIRASVSLSAASPAAAAEYE
eukprot:scaffold3854_cov251-Pinguiococcus_pyrenoidosus.AAC.11